MAEGFDDSGSVDVGRVFAVLSGARIGLVVAFLLGAAVAGIFAAQSPNIYRATTILSPVKSDSGVASGLRSQLGSLAAIAGVDIGNGSGTGRSVEAIATLGSSGFIRSFIDEEQLLPILFANKWDLARKKWSVGVDQPTSEDGVVKFRDKILAISEDRKTSLVTLSVEWTDRELAAKWANLLVDRVNERMRSRAIEESQRSVEYLEKELSKTSVLDLRQAIFGLIESQVNSAMVANVQPEYVFKVVDKATPPDLKRKVAPRRLIIVLVGGFSVASLWAIVILGRYRRRWLNVVDGV